MHTEVITLDRGKARELYRDYKKHTHYSTPIDKECQRAYQLISQGRMVIKALESIVAAGVKTEGKDLGFPKLAICNASATACNCHIDGDGSATMINDASQVRSRWRGGGGVIQSRNVFAFAAGSFAQVRGRAWRSTALVPTPPLHLRPKRGLANYHVLWEAEWTKVVPHDPMLLRRIGRSDLWLVCASWDLTPVERAVFATRL